MLRKFVFLLALIVMLIFLVLSPLPTPIVRAQNTGVGLVYVDFDGGITLYNGATGESLKIFADEAGRTSEYRFVLAPDQRHLAVIVYSYLQTGDGFIDFATERYQLLVFALPSGESLWATSLLPDDFIPLTMETLPGLGTQSGELPTALQVSDPVWAPDGSKVAYISGVSGGDATLHVFDVNTPHVTVLTDEPGYPLDPVWSPDSSQVVYNGIESFGTGAGYVVTGAYVSAADGSTSSKLALNPPAGSLPDFIFLGWLSDSAFVGSWFSIFAGARGLFTYDLLSQTETALLPTTQQLAAPLAFDAESRQVVFSTIQDFSEEGVAPLELGVYKLDVDTLAQAIIYTPTDEFGVSVRAIAPGKMLIDNTVVFNLSDNSLFDLGSFYRITFESVFSPDGAKVLLGGADNEALIFDLITQAATPVTGYRFLNGLWLDNEQLLVRASGGGDASVYICTTDGSCTELVFAVAFGPFAGFYITP